ncbi:MAG: hypothetical protein OXH51_17905 [Gemmatimonadetes bacterium]|nr:hypothetical protein [Gemmatimonadota bacterium]MCY3678159.1 hypothetical protein [Gemmatimonadota bacterium]MYA44208.1 hypothetical protein [Gemmatimonadota bacterium]MYE91742.1 hypothetical protein [Gemmatimonadota bacterium]MYJ09995.1 hypothetical protein [Gemmatimonadota bacterium]
MMTRTRSRRGEGFHLHFRILAVAAVAVAVGSAGCASGSSGSPNAGNDRPVVPGERRTILRVGNYERLEIFNEPGVGVRTIGVAAELAWRALGGVYGELGIPVTSSNPQTMELGNPGYSARRVGGDRMNTFVDCGSGLAGPMANLYDVTLTVSTRLTAKGPQSTEVLTIVDAFGEPRAVSGNMVHCQSRGVLELRVAQEVAEALGITPSP